LNDESKIYMLPADEEELNRLTLQHRLLRLLLGDLLPVNRDIVDKLLQHPDAAILDIGSGSSTWTCDIAEQYPAAKVVGFDLAPGIPEILPANCHIIQGDADTDLGQFAGQFDLVHCRSMAHGTSNFERVVGEMAKCLRPGGILVLAGGDLRVFDENKQPICDASKSHLARLLLAVQKIDERRGANGRSEGFLGILQRNAYLRDEHYTTYHCPLNWAGTPQDHLANGEKLGQMMLSNCRTFLPAWKPLLQSHGFTQDVADDWVKEALEELESGKLRAYTRWHYCWAFKA